jgi:folate-dependent phosphoribosylglycinamide formyltransferase PurN
LSKREPTREKYEIELVKTIKPFDIDLIFFTGWNMIVTNVLVQSFNTIINSHPVLPNTFIGQNSVEKV